MACVPAMEGWCGSLLRMRMLVERAARLRALTAARRTPELTSETLLSVEGWSDAAWGASAFSEGFSPED